MTRRSFKVAHLVAGTCLVLGVVACQPPAVAPKAGDEGALSRPNVNTGGGSNAQTGPGATLNVPGGAAKTPTQPGQVPPNFEDEVAKIDAQMKGPADGLAHKNEANQFVALKDVKPIAVSAGTGGQYQVDGLTVTIPPGALTGDAQLRIRKIDNSERPIMPKLVPGMSFWMDMGGAQVGIDQSVKIEGPVEDKFIAELRKRDPNFDANASKYNLTQKAGKWMLTMAIDGPQTKPAEPVKLDTPLFTTVETADPSFFPVTWFTPTGPLSNSGFKLMSAEGQDHLDGFQTFDDLDVNSITEWIEDDEDPRYEPIDLTRIKTRDANGNVIELDAGLVDPVTGRWKVATGTRSFNPVTHQQNCDFADAGCPDSGAVAKSLARFNHVVTTRFPASYHYPTNLLDADGNPDPRAGQIHPAAGKRKKPPSDLMNVVNNYRTLGNACDNRNAIRVWAKNIWKSDIAGIHLQPARKTFISFQGLEGAAGGEVNVKGRIRPVDDRAMAFETLKGLYNATGYYHEARHLPSGLIVGPRNTGNIDRDRNYEANPVSCYIPRYSPEVTVEILSKDVELKQNDQVELAYSLDDGDAQNAMEIIPPDPNNQAALPTGMIPQLRRATSDGLAAAPFKFYAKVGSSFNFDPGQDPAHKLLFKGVKFYRIEDGKRRQLDIGPDQASFDAAKFVPGTPSSGVWINGHYKVTLRVQSTAAK